MCSIEESDLEDMRSKEEAGRLKSAAVSAGRRTVCQKCRAQPAVLLLRVNDIYCGDCFLAAVTHKFRSTLGKSRLLRPDDAALLAFSGGPASCVLAQLVRDALDQPGSRRLRLRLRPRLLHVDESALLAAAAPGPAVQLAAGYDLPVFSAPLEMVMAAEGAPVATAAPGPGEPDPQPPQELEPLRRQLRQLWTAAGGGSAREQLLARLRNELLARAARQLGCRLLLLAETETRLAVRLLTDLAGGRGAHAHQQTALADDRHRELLVLRPLRELSAKQVALFAHHRRVPYRAGVDLDTGAPAAASIGRATEAFVLGLQADFPATVSTVYRTGTKLSAAGALDATCALCRLPLDTAGGAASALQATRFSELVSASGPASFDYDQLASVGQPEPTASPSVGWDGNCSTGESRCGGDADTACCGDSGCKSGKRLSGKVSRQELLDCMCYGCRLMMRDISDVEALPLFVLDEVASRSRRENMRKEIQDFLFDDS